MIGGWDGRQKCAGEPLNLKGTSVVVGLAILASLTVVGRSGASGPAFEVASIKPAKSPRDPAQISSTAGRFVASTVTLRLLIGYAYDLRDWQISGGPSWVASDVFDIEAKKPPGSGATANFRRDPQLKLMLEALLVDRFKLKLRRETKEGAIYSLVLTKNGPKGKLKKVAERSDAAEAGGVVNYRDSNGPLVIGKNASMSELAKNLSISLERPVLDETGLKGAYDFSVYYAPPQTDYNLPSIFTALQEELGLKLEARRGTVDIYVIEHVEQPSAN